MEKSTQIKRKIQKYKEYCSFYNFMSVFKHSSKMYKKRFYGFTIFYNIDTWLFLMYWSKPFNKIMRANMPALYCEKTYRHQARPGKTARNLRFSTFFFLSFAVSVCALVCLFFPSSCLSALFNFFFVLSFIIIYLSIFSFKCLYIVFSLVLSYLHFVCS